MLLANYFQLYFISDVRKLASILYSFVESNYHNCAKRLMYLPIISNSIFTTVSFFIW